MKNVQYIFLLLLFSISMQAQSQKEAFVSYSARGNSFIGIEGSPKIMGFFKQGRSSIRLEMPTRVKYQYNLLNRLTIAGGIGAEIYASMYANGVQKRNVVSQRYNASIYVQYYPFKSIGLFLEGEFTGNFNDLQNFANSYLQVNLNPGYTIMIGKKKQTALELKAKIYYDHRNREVLVDANDRISVGVKIPLGRKS